MLKLLNSAYEPPSRLTVQRHICSERDDLKLRVKEALRKSPEKVFLTTGAWSSSIYRGYVFITAHWIDQDWKLKSKVIEFKRFATPHTGTATADLLISVINELDLAEKIQCITIDNGSGMCAGIKILHEKPAVNGGAHDDLRSFHIRCVAYVFNLAVKECLHIFREEVNNIRDLISSVRSSVKRREKFNILKVELGLNDVGLPGFDVETR